MAPRQPLVYTWKAMSADKAAGQAVQAGGGTITVTSASSAAVPITFPEPFSQAPLVMLGSPSGTISGVPFIPVQVSDITQTGCTAHFVSLGGATATGSAAFDWIAIGK
jgi:hypothetical protein